MTFEYVTIPPGIDADADIYPRRVGRPDERALYGIDPAFIVEAYVERSTALDLPGKGGRYMLRMPVSNILDGKDGGSGIGFLGCVEWIRSFDKTFAIKGGWLNRDFTFGDAGGFVLDYHGHVNLEEVYPGSTVTDWASPVVRSERIMRLDELRACYHDIKRMSRALVSGTVSHTAWTSAMFGTSYYGDPVYIERPYPAGSGFGTSYVTRAGSESGTLLASGMYCMASLDSSTEDRSWSVEGFGETVYSFGESVGRYKSATALFLLETYEYNGDTNMSYYDIVAKSVGEDGNVFFNNASARDVCVGHRSLQPLKDREYVLSVNCLEACLAVDLNLRTDISDLDWE